MLNIWNKSLLKYKTRILHAINKQFKSIYMVSFNPYFLVGTIGMIFTSFIHMLSNAVTDRASHAGFFVLYLIFAIIIFLGFGNTRKLERVRVRRRN